MLVSKMYTHNKQLILLSKSEKGKENWTLRYRASGPGPSRSKAAEDFIMQERHTRLELGPDFQRTRQPQFKHAPKEVKRNN